MSNTDTNNTDTNSTDTNTNKNNINNILPCIHQIFEKVHPDNKGEYDFSNCPKCRGTLFIIIT
jgi:hypothetical protein